MFQLNKKDLNAISNSRFIRKNLKWMIGYFVTGMLLDIVILYLVNNKYDIGLIVGVRVFSLVFLIGCIVLFFWKQTASKKKMRNDVYLSGNKLEYIDKK